MHRLSDNAITIAAKLFVDRKTTIWRLQLFIRYKILWSALAKTNLNSDYFQKISQFSLQHQPQPRDAYMRKKNKIRDVLDTYPVYYGKTAYQVFLYLTSSFQQLLKNNFSRLRKSLSRETCSICCKFVASVDVTVQVQGEALGRRQVSMTLQDYSAADQVMPFLQEQTPRSSDAAEFFENAPGASHDMTNCPK